MTRRLVVFNFEGVIVSTADPYAHFLKKATELGIENSCDLQKQRLLYPTKNFQAEISQLLENIRSKTGDEIQKVSQQIADETQIRIGVRSVFETLQRDETVDILVISDYNNVMLEQTLAAKKIAVGKVDIITNTLRSIAYGEYRPVLRSRNFVICKYCPSNLCRGQQFLCYLREANQRGISFSKMVLVGSSRSDLCIARYLRQKDYLCAPIGSELANILTKVTKKERFFKRIMQKTKIRVQTTHTCLYLDARFISDIVNNYETHNSSYSHPTYVTLLQEKKALLNRVSSQLLPSSKLRHQLSTEIRDNGAEYQWKVSTPFTVNKQHQSSILSINDEDSQAEPTQKRRFTNDEPKDYFCRRRGPNDMPRGQSKLLLEQKVDDLLNKGQERQRHFLPFSRSHTEPIPASKVQTPPATSIWNELYKCQQLPPNNNNNNGALTRYHNNYMNHFGKVKSGMKFCFDNNEIFNAEHPENQQTDCNKMSIEEDSVDEVNQECFFVNRKQIRSDRMTIGNACSSSSAQSLFLCPLNSTSIVSSDSGDHHSKNFINERENTDSKSIVMRRMSGTSFSSIRKRTCSMPVTTTDALSRRSTLPSYRVRSGGKIISENLLRNNNNDDTDRNHIIMSDVMESAKTCLKGNASIYKMNNSSQCNSDSREDRSNNNNNGISVIHDSKNSVCNNDNQSKISCIKEKNTSIFADTPTCNQLPYEYFNLFDVSVKSNRNKNDKVIEIGRDEDENEEMIYVRQIESYDDINDNNNNDNSSDDDHLADVVYEQFNFAPTTHDNHPKKQEIMREDTNTYGIIDVISGKVYSS